MKFSAPAEIFLVHQRLVTMGFGWRENQLAWPRSYDKIYDDRRFEFGTADK